MKARILLLSSMLILAPYAQSEDNGYNISNKMAQGAAAGAAIGYVALPAIGGYADEKIFNKSRAFSTYNSAVTEKILKDFRVPSSGAVIVKYTTKSGIQKSRFAYKNREELRNFLADFESEQIKNGSVSTNAKGHRPYKIKRNKARFVKGAGGGLVTGAAAGLVISLFFQNSDPAGELQNTANNDIEIVADPDEIVTTWLSSD